MKVELDSDETWALMSYVVDRLLGETDLTDADRARIRRWRSEQMRPAGEPMKLLTRKINEDLGDYEGHYGPGFVLFENDVHLG